MTDVSYKLKFHFEPDRTYAGDMLNRIFMEHEFIVEEGEFSRMLGEAGMSPGISISMKTESRRRHSTPLGRS